MLRVHLNKCVQVKWSILVSSRTQPVRTLHGDLMVFPDPLLVSPPPSHIYYTGCSERAVGTILQHMRGLAINRRGRGHRLIRLDCNEISKRSNHIGGIMWMDGRTDGRTYGRTDGRTYGRTDGRNETVTRPIVSLGLWVASRDTSKVHEHRLQVTSWSDKIVF